MTFTYVHVPGYDLCLNVHDLDLCTGVADLDLRAAASVPSVPRNARRELHPANQVRGTHYAGFVHIQNLCLPVFGFFFGLHLKINSVYNHHCNKSTSTSNFPYLPVTK